MNWRRVLRQGFGEHEVGEATRLSHRFLPVGSRCPRRTVRGGLQGAQRFAAIGHDAEVDVAVAADLVTFDVHLNESRLFRNDQRALAAGEQAKAGAENEAGVELHAHLSEGAESGKAAAGQLVVFGHHAARFRVGEHGNAGAFGEGDEGLPGSGKPGAAADEDGRPLRLTQPLDGLLDGRGGGRRRCFRPQLLREVYLRLVDAAEQNVGRDLQKDRSRPARGGDAQRLGDQFGNALHVRNAVRPLRDRLHEGHLVEAALQRQGLGVDERRSAADEQGRHTVEVGVGDTGDDVGDARPGGDDSNARCPGCPCPGVGGVAGSLLVAHVDEADVVVESGLEDGVQMPAVQGEDFPDALLLQHAHEHFTAVDFCHQNLRM
jgi:hypothetical protein